VRHILLRTLGSAGFETLDAETAAEGLSLARAQSPDMIISDVEMPGGDGYQVLASLRTDAATASIPFIFVTGQGSEAGMRRGMSEGADDYLLKPFTAEDLLATVHARFLKQEESRQHGDKRLEAFRHELASSLPHEFRTPLTIILAMSEIMTSHLASLPSQKVVEWLRDIHRNGKRLERICESYWLYVNLSFWRGDQGAVKTLRGARCPGAGGIAASTAREQSERHGRVADLVLDVNEDAAAAGPAISPEYAAKIVSEIVDNAFKFSKPGTCVEVRAGADVERWHLFVSDRGPGLKPEQIREIGAFKQFERASKEQQGLGMGLTLAKGLVEIHGGTFEIQSTPQGTTVAATMPLAASLKPLS
jgi:two-component system sensor histidine kinase/response regulator